MLVQAFESEQDVLTYIRSMTEYNGAAGKITKEAGTGNFRSSSGRVGDQERRTGSIGQRPMSRVNRRHLLCDGVPGPTALKLLGNSKNEPPLKTRLAWWT